MLLEEVIQNCCAEAGCLRSVCSVAALAVCAESSASAFVAAFATYDDSLRANLKVCVEGTRLVDCDALPPTGSGPPPPPPGAAQDCGSAGTFQLELSYQGRCAGPARLKVRHDPTLARRIDLAAGSFDPKAEALDTVAYEPQGCHAELVYRGPAGELRLTFDGAGGRRVEGIGTLAAARGGDCPVQVSGSFGARRATSPGNHPSSGLSDLDHSSSLR